MSNYRIDENYSYTLIPIDEIESRLSTDLYTLCIATNALVAELRKQDLEADPNLFWDEVLLWGRWDLDDIRRHIDESDCEKKLPIEQIALEFSILIIGLGKYVSRQSSISALVQILLAKNQERILSQEKQIKSLQAKKAPLAKKINNSQYDIDLLKPYFDVYCDCSIDPPSASGFWRGIKKLKKPEEAERDWCAVCIQWGMPKNKKGGNLGEARVTNAFKKLIERS